MLLVGLWRVVRPDPGFAWIWHATAGGPTGRNVLTEREQELNWLTAIPFN
jgi:hypothetical protein